MPRSDREPRTRTRRRLLGVGSAIALASVLPARADEPAGTGPIFVISRERLLHEAKSAKRLHEAETAMTDQLQSLIDRTKEQFSAEEEELTRLRATLPSDQFDARVSEFDQRVRQARRTAQERAAELQKGFQDARAAIVGALPALMERLRTEAGASAILNAEQALAYDPAIDLTERAIELFDAEGPSPAPPAIDLSQPLSADQSGPGKEPDKPAR